MVVSKKKTDPPFTGKAALNNCIGGRAYGSVTILGVELKFTTDC